MAAVQPSLHCTVEPLLPEGRREDKYFEKGSFITSAPVVRTVDRLATEVSESPSFEHREQSHLRCRAVVLDAIVVELVAVAFLKVPTRLNKPGF
jgi:hypothetical protein